MLSRLPIVLLALAGHAVLASEPPAPPSDLDALELADQAPPAAPAPTPPASSWRLVGELAAGFDGRGGAHPGWLRASLDLRLQQRLSPGWRAVLSNRLDLTEGEGPDRDDATHTLREAYLSWKATDTLSLDLGRVNVRHGAAMGYNPTDWFKTGALRSVTSVEPQALRENRQGTVAARLQGSSPLGAWSFVVSPKLARDADDAPLSLDPGATNPRLRWLATLSPRLLEGISTQLLLQHGQGQRPQLGLNLSGLLGEATVAYAELGSGSGASMVSSATAAPVLARHERAALGLTHTLAAGLSLTLELQHNGAGPTRAQWDQLRGADPLALARLLAAAERDQELAGRRAVFVNLLWPDALAPGWDLAGFWLHELQGSSRATWLELKRRGDGHDLVLQWQRFLGRPGTWFGSTPSATVLSLAWRHYFH